MDDNYDYINENNNDDNTKDLINNNKFNKNQKNSSIEMEFKF